MSYLPLTERDKNTLLEDIGIHSFEDLLKGIPGVLRNPLVNIPEALSEMEIRDQIQRLGAKNKTTGQLFSFLGGGSYEHFIPAVVPDILGRHEFYTAYTPYQPEASQGTLQAIFEYQSLMTELTGLDVSNASHYDGATSLAEAALLALHHTGRNKILVAASLHPHYREVLKTYLRGSPYSMVELGFNKDKTYDRETFQQVLSEEFACVIFQSPNFFGVVEDFEGIAEQVHNLGALWIVSANPISLGVLKPPGEWGADVAAGEGQPLGIPLQFGGPYLGYFCVTRALQRQIPGRLCGLTRDADGKRAFCLTLQAREQHIRRERAASNICSNQALCALAACVYMTLLGKRGIREVGEMNVDRAYYLREKIAGLSGYSVNCEVPIFNEFVVKGKKPFSTIENKLMKKNILPGISLERFYPGVKGEFLVCVTETKTRDELDSFAEALGQC